MMLLGKIFHGADPRQVPASQIEQAFQAGTNNVWAVAKAGMISRDEVLVAMRAFLQKGDEFYKENEKALGPAGEKGKANMHKVVDVQIAAAPREIAVTRTRSLDLVAARQLYMPVTKSGWYPASLEAGRRLVDLYLSDLPQNVGEKAASVAAGAASVLNAPLAEWLPMPTWVGAVGAFLLAAALGGAD
jgi:hypothetical protein